MCVENKGNTQNGLTYLIHNTRRYLYEGWNFNSGKYLFTTDTK